MEDNTIAGYWISCIDQQARQDEFIRGLDDKSLDDRTIRDIVGRHKNSKPTAAITTLRRQLEAWEKQPSNLHRKYNWYTGAQLKIRIKQIDTRANTTGTKAVLLETLVDCETKQKEQNQAIASGEVC